MSIAENLALAARRGMARGVGWALNRNLTESFRDQSRNILYFGFCPDCNIKSFLNHVYSSVRGLDEDRNFRIHPHIAGERMSQTPLRQQDWAAEPNEPRRLPT